MRPRPTLTITLSSDYYPDSTILDEASLGRFLANRSDIRPSSLAAHVAWIRNGKGVSFELCRKRWSNKGNLALSDMVSRTTKVRRMEGALSIDCGGS